MTWEAWATLLVLAATVAALVRDRVPPAFAVLGGTVTLLLVGVIDEEEAFSGFANPAPLTVAALYVLARAVEVTGTLEPLVRRLLGDGSAAVPRLVVPTAAASGFLNNTPIVAMLVPQVVEWADRRGLPRSRFLMPLSYAAVLGGVLTAIGTSTNLVVSGLLVAAGEPPVGMFELTPAGLPVAAAGLLVLALLARRLLPDRSAARTFEPESGRQFTVTMRVVADGPLDGKSVEDGGLRSLQGVYLVQIERADRVTAPVAPTEVLEGGDELTFVGRVDDVVDLQRNRGLESTEAHHLTRLPGAEQSFFEAVIGDGSPLVGRTLRDVGFRGRYQAAVVAVHRQGQRLDAKLGQVQLRAGDTLLLLADREWRARWRESGDFLVIAGVRSSEPRPRGRKGLLAGVLIVAVVLLAGADVLPILHASLLGAIVVVLLGVLTPRQARSAVDVDVFVVIAASFGLGAAVAESGLARILADGLLGGLAPLGPVGALGGVLIATMLLTELISNNAAAVLMFPIATATAGAAGANPRAFAMAVLFGASLSFLTPIGYQTNLMVYGLGGYRFGDFTRLGIPVNLAVVVTALVAIPLVWPL